MNVVLIPLTRRSIDRDPFLVEPVQGVAHVSAGDVGTLGYLVDAWIAGIVAPLESRKGDIDAESLEREAGVA